MPIPKKVPIKSKTGRYSVSRKGMGGRPTKYEPGLCHRLVAHMAQGLSFESFAATVNGGINSDSLYHWAESHPEFLEAKKLGFNACRLWWEKLSAAAAADDPTYQLEILKVKPFLKKHTVRTLQNGDTEDLFEYHVPRASAALICFNMVNRFRQTTMPWYNAERHEITGKDGGPIQTENKSKVQQVPFDTSNLTSDQLREVQQLLTLTTGIPA